MGCLPGNPRLPNVKEQHRTGKEGEGGKPEARSELHLCLRLCVRQALLAQPLMHGDKLFSMTHSSFPD